MLSRRLVRVFARSSASLARAMSVYVFPVDPSSPSSKVDQIDTERLWQSVPRQPDAKPKAGTAHVFYAVGPGNDTVALSTLGPKFTNPKVKPEEKRELVRQAIGSGVKQVRSLAENTEAKEVTVDASLDPHAAAVAAHLAAYTFSLKTSPPSPFDPRDPDAKAAPEKISLKPLTESKEWEEGVVYAYAQNLARTLMELPANVVTPTAFTERIKTIFANVPNTTVIVRDEAWAAEKGMRTFLSVAKGTKEPAKFLEIHYNGASKDVAPLVLIGKGVTFDSGGISLKPSSGMKLMRGDMGGAAAVASAAWGIAKLGIPINLVVLTPLTENLPGPTANKPGDIVYAMNGKSVEIDNTDAEGRLILSDALYYGSTEFKPKTLVDVSTLTGAMDVALGEIYTGIFTNSDSLWEELQAAGEREWDRFWRMPLTEEYGPQIYLSNADLCNTGGKPAGSCTAALFLKNFIDGVDPSEEDAEPKVRWAHLDIAGTMEATRPSPYQEKGMTGRSTRALIEFTKNITV